MKATLSPKRLSRVPLVSILVNMYYTVYFARNYWAGSEKEGHGWARMAQKGVSHHPEPPLKKNTVFLAAELIPWCSPLVFLTPPYTTTHL